MNDFEKQIAGQQLKRIPSGWRAGILSAAEARSRPAKHALDFAPLHWLREMLWPCPQAWGALAAVWVIIAAFQLVTRTSAPPANREMAKANVISVAEQRRELAELLGPTGPRERSPADRPRSARFVNRAFV